MTIPSGTHLGPYEILNLVGAGGMGEVYRARDTRLGRDVAIKILPPDTASNRDRLNRFEKEARMASALNHPNIVTIYDIGEANSVPYIAMELVSGKTLREILSSGALPLSRTLSIGLQIADGLAKAHDAGIVHRDLKPENIMVTDDSLVKILDFGLGKHLFPQFAGNSPESTIQANSARTSPGSILGTVDYMSPEQAAGREVDFRSDQFAFGTLVYEMTTGHRPFTRPTAVQTMSAIIAEPPRPLTHSTPPAPDPLRAVTSRCLEKDPGRRYASTRELAADLRSLSTLVQISGAGPATRKAKRSLSAGKRRAAGVILLAAVSILVLALARYLIQGRSETIDPIPNAKNLVILPFRGLGGDDRNREFSAGLTEAVTAALTQLTTIPSLQVAPSSEVRIRKIAGPEDARRDLGANLAITGQVEQQGDNLLVSWNLLETAKLRQLRTRTISVRSSDPAAVEDRTIEGILETLELDLKPEDRAALLNHDTRIPAAKTSYLQALGYLQDYDKPENISHAISLFEEARKLDPGYARAYAGLGLGYWRKYENTKQQQWIDSAQEACNKSLSLNAGLAAAHGCLATVHSGLGRYEAAVGEFQKALESEPTNDDFRRELARSEEKLNRLDDAEKTLREAITLRAHYWANYNLLGRFFFNQGRYTEAAEMFTQVIKLAPDSLYGYSNLGGAYVHMGRNDLAIPQFERSVAIRPTATAYSNLGTAYFDRRQFLPAVESFEKAAKLDETNYAIWGNLGDAYYFAAGKRSLAVVAYDKAIALGEQALKVNPRDAMQLSRISTYYAMSDKKQLALSNLKRALDLAPNDPTVRFKAALIYNQFKDADQTFEWLEKALKAGYSVDVIRHLPNFDPLWEDRRFQNLLRSY